MLETEEAPRRIITRAADTAREMLDMDMAYVTDIRGGVQEFVCIEGDGASFGADADRPAALEGSYCQLLLQGRLGNIVADAPAHPLVGGLPVTHEAGIGAYVGVPVVRSDGEVLGTLCCLSHEPDPTLRDRDVRFLAVLARLVADQLDEVQRAQQAHRLALVDGHVRALLAALGARDGYTEAHSAEVVALACRVGRHLDLGPEQLEQLEYAALLHDIGKIGVSDAILQKPGPLTEEEWAQMRRHPVIGEQIVASMSALDHLSPAIRAEHERWDGAGYPDGLSGEEIPLASRIVLVCDAYHAMTSDRPYRVALPPWTAVEELERNAGVQFCPRAVAALSAVLRG